MHRCPGFRAPSGRMSLGVFFPGVETPGYHCAPSGRMTVGVFFPGVETPGYGRAPSGRAGLPGDVAPLPRVAWVTFSVVLAMCGACAGQTFLAHDLKQDLYRFSVSDPQPVFVSNTGLGDDPILEIERSADGLLYGLTGSVPGISATLFAIDPKSGELTLVLDAITIAQPSYSIGPAFVPDGDSFWMCSGRGQVQEHVSRIGLDGGGTIDSFGASFTTTLAVRQDGYLVAVYSSSLFVIDPSDGTTTLLAPLDPAIEFASAITVHDSTMYFLAALDGEPNVSALFELDPMTGEQSLVVVLDQPYIGGFGLAVISCQSDVNGDGELNVLDFVAFQLAWQAREPIADCDSDGDWTVLDVVCFQALFVDGCD